MSNQGGAEYSDPGTRNPDWMSNLSGDISLNNLSVPGTHNTMTFDGYGGDLFRCQSLPLEAQLEAGIRFLDIRCRHYNDGFPIHNGERYQHWSFIDVLRETTRFLRNHPSETILMRIKEEHTSGDNSRDMIHTFRKYIGEYDPKTFWTVSSDELPELSDARGRIVILDDFAGGQAGPSYRQATIADDLKVNTILSGDIDAKWNSVRSNLDKARADTSDKLFITFSTGASSGAYPNAVAAKINPKLMGFFSSNPGQNKWGIVAMDFPEGSLVEQIIRTNYQ
ncbi:1-phosphatidylinositol phosphodiesterase-like [Ptychodera flava]|uniref:1-phosphatidylinositol phosphodiesterase-like n=1 Tax=Ptychodera flava TaxID=63121 RepID=UPI003969EE1E